MDKEPSFLLVVLVTLLGSIAAYFSARHKPWLLVAVLSVFGILAFAHLSEVTDPFVGPAIAAEAGIFYVLLSWANPILMLIFASYGLFIRGRNVKVNT